MKTDGTNRSRAISALLFLAVVASLYGKMKFGSFGFVHGG